MQHPPKVFFPFLDMTIKKGAGQDQQVNTISISRIDLILFLYFRLWCPFLVENGINFLFYFLKRIETGGAGVDIYFFTSGFVIPLLLIPFFFRLMPMDGGICFLLCSSGGCLEGCLRKIRRFRWLRFHLIYRHHTDGWLLILFSKWPDYIHLETCGCCSTNVLIWIYF